MTRIRRILLLAAMTLAVIISGSVVASAQAAFADSAAVSTSIATATVAPATNVAGSVSCGGRWATVTVNWTRSTAARVSGHVVKAYWSDGLVETMATTNATTTTASKDIDVIYMKSYTVTLRVVTQTSYGWTSESGPTAVLSC